MAKISVLIKDEKYIGKYVALKDFDDNKVCGSGNTPEEAYKQAEKNGCHNAVIIFAPLKDLTQVYQ